jgi:hypothetical protein
MNITTPIHTTSIFVGLDVHKDTINLAALGPDGKRFLLERVYRTDDLARLRKDLDKLGKKGTVFCCYEASSAGFVLWRKMQGVGYPLPDCCPVADTQEGWAEAKVDRSQARA